VRDFRPVEVIVEAGRENEPDVEGLSHAAGSLTGYPPLYGVALEHDVALVLDQDMVVDWVGAIEVGLAERVMSGDRDTINAFNVFLIMVDSYGLKLEKSLPITESPLLVRKAFAPQEFKYEPELFPQLRPMLAEELRGCRPSSATSEFHTFPSHSMVGLLPQLFFVSFKKFWKSFSPVLFESNP
jgi:hypothetical protein